ncbi:twin-arginine translocase TatA/TatE family subunit [Rummeliibacillus sp. G93]|uniref:Sec-independent protein translocase protein TatA n=1 Tax=Rummeliibacillus stabekisii TaxID=241244 RepID=A0A143HFV6_9BACL|nr:MULTISPECIES: twin-arginine translocase TatA/TatE family subunit [Rummeliibacillus]AMX00132.1 preprotein translocase subunit TatA [Rummeliibacillus stabekisii]UQW97048.1 twin-arginine translocase TatA/TatE family subunit [Rummeliibacillus sp. G93]
MGISPVTAIILAVVAIIIFGPKKLPELGKAMGTTLREFKKATNGLMEDDEPSKKPSESTKSEDK